MQHHFCPKCHSSANVESRYSILLTLVDWQLLLAFALCIGAFGNLLKLGFLASVGFIIIGLLPLAVRIIEKLTCESCDIEFRREEAHKVSPKKV